MVTNKEANLMFSTFLLVKLQLKMWLSFFDICFEVFFLFLQQTGANIGSNFFQTLLWISLGWWKIYWFITIKDWCNILSAVMSHHRWDMLVLLASHFQPRRAVKDNSSEPMFFPTLFVQRNVQKYHLHCLLWFGLYIGGRSKVNQFSADRQPIGGGP